MPPAAILWFFFWVESLDFSHRFGQKFRSRLFDSRGNHHGFMLHFHCPVSRVCVTTSGRGRQAAKGASAAFPFFFGLANMASRHGGALQVRFSIGVPSTSSACATAEHGQVSVIQTETDEPHSTTAVPAARTMKRSWSSPCIPIQMSATQKQEIRKVEVLGSPHTDPHLASLLQEASKALDCCVEPESATGGLGGAYSFKNRNGRSIAIVKPIDEEPFAHNNPNGYVGRSLGQPGLKRTIRVGEAGPREVAAYLLDHHGFAGVPHTCLVKVVHPFLSVNGSDMTGSRCGPPTKIASFQEYIHHDYDASEHGASRFPISQVHRIGILDIRIMNTDRHSGNILVRRTRGHTATPSSAEVLLRVDDPVELIPIDHGFCLPESVESAYFEWLHWPQASLPFSQEELTYISALDANAEVKLLKAALPMLHPGALRMLVMATTLLQKAAVAGFTVGEIGGMMTRELRGMDEEASQFETMCTEAKLCLTRLLAEEAEAECHKPIAAQGSFEKDNRHGIEEEPLHFEMDGEDMVGQSLGTDAEAREGFTPRVNVPETYSGFARPAFDRVVMMSPYSQSTSSRTDISSSSSPFGLYFSPCSAPSVSPPVLPLEEYEGCSGACMPRLDGVRINRRMGGSREWHVVADATGVDPNSYPTLSRSASGKSEVQGATEVYGASSELQNAFPADGCMIFSELSEKHWTMYMDILRDEMSSVLDDCKQQSGMSSKRFGTSCMF